MFRGCFTLLMLPVIFIGGPYALWYYAFRVPPQASDVYVEQAEALLEQGEYQQVLTLLDEVKPAYEDDYRLWTLEAKAAVPPYKAAAPMAPATLSKSVTT